MGPKHRWEESTHTNGAMSADPRVPTSYMSKMQAHLIAASGEFIGTFLFLYFAYAGQLMIMGQKASDALAGGLSNDSLVYIALVYGFSLLVNAWVFYRISGGLFNPAVTLGLCVSAQLDWTRAAFLVPAQILASMVAGGLAEAMFPGNIDSVNTTLSPGVSIVQGLFIEMLMTVMLTLTILMLAAEKSKATFIAPVGIGLALFVPMLAGAWATGGSLNPARSFGCAVAARSFPGYHWLYWLGPCLGALLAAGFYRFIKYFHYEEVNPGQDASYPPSSHLNLEHV